MISSGPPREDDGMERLRVLTWHVHGNYLLYLSQARVEFYLPVSPGGAPGYGGRGDDLPVRRPNVHDVPAEAVRDLEFDCVLFQSRRNYEVDQHEILSRAPAAAAAHLPGARPAARAPDRHAPLGRTTPTRCSSTSRRSTR